MSSYRSNYGPWSKSTTSSGYSGISKNASSKYDSTYTQPRIEISKAAEDKAPSRLRSKYAFSAGYQPSTSASTARLTPTVEKKSIHPPVSYRPMNRSGALSRESSPGDASTRSASSYNNYSTNRLYPGNYSRSVSKERTEPASTIPKYQNRSLTKEIPKYTGAPTSPRTSSREELTTASQKYITSRFLPKNTVQKSYTAYTRPSTIRTNETSRKNRELLNVINAQQEQEKTSRSPSRCSSVASENISKTSSTEPSNDIPNEVVEETESISVTTRSTSPIQSQAPRSRRAEVARVVEKIITRPKRRKEMVDKEIQSDRMDDTAKFSRFGSSSTRIAATPWSSFLDMKFSSPEQKSNKSGDEQEEKSQSESGSKKNSPRNSLSNLSRSFSKLNMKNKEEKAGGDKSKPKSSDKKHLPPQIPKADSPSKSIQQTPNKDFRKSVLNMNHDGKPKKDQKRSGSVSSADSGSEAQLSEVTDVSENLTTCGSFPKTNSSSKLPQRVARSPSSDNSSSSSIINSGSEDENKTKKSGGKRRNSTSSRTSVMLSSADDVSLDKSQKPPLSPRVKSDSAEAKSFLMRALAPVTNLFKNKHQDDERINWMDSTSENTDNLANHSIQKQGSDPKPSRKVIQRVESGERAWWMDEKSEPSESKSNKITPEEKIIQKKIRHVDSGEGPWWMEEEGEAPDGVQVYAVPDIVQTDDRVLYKIRRNDSESKAWWLDSNENISEANKKSDNQADSSDYFEKHKIRHIDSGERAWWLTSSENICENSKTEEEIKPALKIRRQDSGEKSWWMDNSEKDSSKKERENDSDNEEFILGDRASPEGLETPRDQEMYGRTSPYDNVPSSHGRRPSLFISRHTNIDDILGGTSQLLSPLMDKIFSYRRHGEECEEINPGQVKIHDSTPQRGVIQPGRLDNLGGFPKSFKTYSGKLDDAALQLYKDGDYGSYLDLEASISEQQEEFEGFQSNKKNSIVLRTQLSVRVHTIIEKLLTSEGRELRRALFSLKQIFQEDKDLVHEFVQNDGLTCLIKVGSEADQNYQNYILRALGQVMLYVDGMNGVMEHNQTVQWLYTLISSKFRLVVKTALKLLLVFAEYTDSNCMLLIKAINSVDCSQGLLPWHNIMKLLKDFDSADTELLIYATTLINKVLNGIPDQDTYYDQTDALEEQGIEAIIQRYMAKPGTDLDLLQQFQIYEAVLQYEDNEEKCITPIRHLDESIRKTLRTRKSVVNSAERRKSRRHSTGNSSVNKNNSILQANVEDDYESSSSHSSELNNLNGSYKDSNKANDAGVTPALKRRRERAERQRSFMKEQQESVALLRKNSQNNEEPNVNGNYTSALQQRIANGNLNHKDLTPIMNAVNKLDTEENLTKQPWILSMMYGKPADEQTSENIQEFENENDRNLLLQLKRENTVKDLTQKLANQNILHSPDENKVNRIGDMSGLISKAMEGLAKSKSKADVLKSPTTENVPKTLEIKKSENELRWEELMSNLDRPLNLCDMDFTDLATDDETDVLAPVAVTNGIPPPPPPMFKENGVAPPPPPLSNRIIPPPVPNPPLFGYQKPKQMETKIPIKKNKKTVKLFWKEVRDDPISSMKLKSGLIWDELNPVTVDTQKLEHLFESRAKDLITKKQQEMNKNKEIIVLDPKRSNAINIGMTKLPPPRSIKTAILKMDATIMNREGIEKLLTMLPTEEERTKIQDAQAANPDLPLGSAEQFLLTLASISELPARLKLWAFKLDFENSEREIAEPLMDLKQGIEVLRLNKTFRGILSTLLSIGNFLNGNEVKGFQIEYLAKVPEVKDTVHKHSLLHHLCHIVMEKFPDASDLYSEIGAITRASKIDFDELAQNVHHLESDCKASWDHLKVIAKHDGSTMMKVKMSDFLSDCAERIILLGIIHRRVTNRYHKFLLWLGIPMHQISDSKPNEFCRVVSEFALEYRTTRERVLQQLEKKANHRERNKTRGKMITEIGKFRTKEDRADAELRQLLGSDISDVESMQGTLPWRRTRRESNRSILCQPNGNLTDGDDEILESLVKTATKGPSRTAPRERKRTRHADRKSLRRTLKNGLSEEEKKHLSAYIKGY